MLLSLLPMIAEDYTVNRTSVDAYQAKGCVSAELMQTEV